MKPSLIEPLESRYAPAALVGIANPQAQAENAASGKITFVITLSEEAVDAITVHYQTENIEALSGEDYVAVAGDVTFQPGETSHEITVDVSPDAKFEGDETFRVVLSNPTSGADLDPAHTTGVATILNDDAAPTLSVSNVSKNENAQTMTFTLTLSAASGLAATGFVSTVDGSAVAGLDYSPLTNQSFTIPAGQTSVTVSVPMLNDDLKEGPETFLLNVTSADPNVNVPSGLSATGTITDDDLVTMSVGHITIDPEGTGTGTTTATFKITLSNPASSNVTVHYASLNGTAFAGSDYLAVDGTATFTPGQVEYVVTIPITRDSLYEGNEVFYLQLSDASSNVGSITQDQGMATIVDDDVVPTLTLKGPNNQGSNFSILENADGTHVAQVTLTLSGPSQTATVFHFATLSQTGAGFATAGDDYTALDQDITFAPGETVKTVQIPITDDATNEADELFNYKVTLVSGSATISGGGNGSVKILNDDRKITVGDQTITESNGDTVLNFTVTLDGPTDQVISFDYATANLTALASVDYVAKNGTVIFNPGDSLTKTISITIKGDDIGELDKDFALNFTNVANATINKTSVKGHILDDDPFLSISDARVIEGANGSTGSMQFTVTLLRATGTVTVNYATADGSATTAGNDYAAKTGTLTFAPGQTTKTITVPILGDNDNENDEQFTVTLSNPTGISNIAKSVGTGTIVDDEGLIVVSNGTIVEGDSGKAFMVFAVNVKNRSAVSSKIQFSYETIDGTAVSTGANPDFDGITNGTVTLDTSVDKTTIMVPIVGDTIFEGTQTFTLRIYGVIAVDSNGTPIDTGGIPPASIGNEFATGTITDNDAKPIVSVSAGNVVEGNVANQGVPYTITLNHGSDTAVTVDFKTQGGSATAGTDYTAVITSITFAPGETTKTVYVPLLGDTGVEADETVIGVISNALGATLGTKTATGKILNDDVAISVDGFTVTEGMDSVGKMTLTFSAKPVADVVLNFAVNGATATAGADFSLTGSTTRTIKPTDLVDNGDGTWKTTIDFNIVNDTLNENPETFTVSLNGATNAVINPAKTTATGTINDNDPAPVISISNASIVEGSGTKTMTFTVSLDHASGNSVDVRFDTADGTAISTNDQDFTHWIDQRLTFAPGQTTQTISVTITGDGVDEPTETFSVVLSDPHGGTLSDDHKIGTGTISDDDQRTIQVSTVPVVEGTVGDTKTLEYVVTLSSAAAQQITVDFVVANGTAVIGTDYTVNGSSSGTITFAPGVTEQKVILTIVGDDLPEGDETVLLRLSNPTNGKLSTTEVVGKILTDETYFTITPVTGSVAEGGALTYVVTRFGNKDLTSSVTYTTTDGTTAKFAATASGGDYNGVSGTLLFNPGDETKTITVQTRQDTIFENNESFFVNLTGSVNGILTNDGDSTHAYQSGGVKSTATITNDDALPTISITSAVNVTEGKSGVTANAVFTVSLSSPIGADDVLVTFTTADGTAFSAVHGDFAADYNPQTNGTVRLVAGALSQTITIAVAGDDIDEFNETFQVQLTGATLETSSTPVSFAPGKSVGTATIIDDDVAPTITIADPTNATAEGSGIDTTGTISIILKDATGATVKSEKPITVKVGTRNGTAELGSDFLLPDDFQETITFAPGETTKTVSFTIVGDTMFEADEKFAVVLSAPTNATLKDSGAVFTIDDDDTAPQLSINNLTVTEADSGFTNMVFTVSLAGSSYLPVTVDFTTKDGTAKANSAFPDYVPISGSLTFAPGETTKTITVQVYGDIYAEDNESFTVVLSNAVNGSILTATGSGTIENGADSIIGIAVRDASVREGDSSDTTSKTVDFVVELSKAAGVAINFSALTRNGTAVAGSDFVVMQEDGDTDTAASSTNNDFVIAANETSKTVSITTVRDTVFEATENFYLSIGNVSSGVTVVRSEARGTIFNDDIQFLNNNKTAQYIDVDGDLVTVSITKGVLNATIDATSINSGAVLIFGTANELGGRSLIGLDFTLSPSLFNGTSLTITADAQAGFDTSGKTPGDGRVNVGYIRGAQVQSTVLQFVNGIDFTNITVDGDIGKITAGDLLTTPSIRGKLTAYSIGARAAATTGIVGNPNDPSDTTSLNYALTAGFTLPTDELAFAGSGTTKTSNLISAFLSTVNSIDVETNVFGTLQVIGGVYGNINSLRIGGALQGIDTINSGVVFYTGTLKSATLGNIIGGTARDSGLINGRTDMVGNIGSLHILGDIKGGKDDNSGRVVAKQIGSIVIDGSILGGGGTFNGSDGAGTDSGEVFAATGIKNIYVGGDVKGGSVNNTGQIFTNGAIGSLYIGGSVLGSSAASTSDSGKVTAGGGLTSATILGDIQGGAGARSGSIQIAGSIGKIVVGSADAGGGNLIGGSGADSGTISAGGRIGSSGLEVSGGTLTSAILYGNIQGGAASGSGGILAGTQITKLDLRGSLIGGDSLGDSLDAATGAVTRTGYVLAGRIAQMTVGGDVRSGTDSGNGLYDSGSIRSIQDIASLTIHGDVVGSATTRAVISAGLNGSKGAASPAIGNLTIGGTTTSLDIAAGYIQTDFSSALGTAYNADASIGNVVFQGDVKATNVIAGVTAGTDGRFGTDDDVKIGQTSTSDNAKITSTIAKVTFNGQILDNDNIYGISAQYVASVIARQSSNPVLTKGAANDHEIDADPENTAAKLLINEAAL